MRIERELDFSRRRDDISMNKNRSQVQYNSPILWEMMSSPSSVIVVFLLSIFLLEMASDVDASLLKKVFKKFIFSGLPLPLIVGLTAHHPV